jgi:hypothetical protein
LIGLPLSEEVPDAVLNLRSTALKLVGLATLQEVRDSLAEFRTKIPEFVKRCKAEKLWGPAGGELSKGVSLWHLATFLASVGGTDTLVHFYGATQVPLSGSIAGQVAMAREIAQA